MHKIQHLRTILISSLFSFLFFGANSVVSAQETKVKLTSEAKKARDQSLKMLDEMEEILKEYYYDPKFSGIDLKSRIETAKARVKTLEHNWQMHRVLVQVLMDFNDSHTRMILPPRTDYFQYGFGMQMIGDEYFSRQLKTAATRAIRELKSATRFFCSVNSNRTVGIYGK